MKRRSQARAEYRVKKYLVTPKFLLQMHGKVEVVQNALPKDAEIGECAYDARARSFVIYVYSMQFPQVALGNSVPIAEPPVFKRLD